MGLDPLALSFIQQIKSGSNPQQLIMSYLEKQMKGNPLGENLLALAKNNDQKGIEEVVRNIASQKGIDFDKEFPIFKQMLGL